MRRTAVLTLALGFALSACVEPVTEPTAPVTRVDALQSSTGSPFSRPAANVSLPAGALVADQPLLVEPTECSSTPLIDYLNASVDEVFEQDLAAYIELFFFGDYLLPLYEAAYLGGPTGRDAVYGYDGDFTNVLSRTDRAARRFWDIDTDQLELVAAKGTMLADASRLSNMYQFFYGYPADFADELADYVSGLVRVSPVLDGGNHPALSFNALAIQFADGAGRVVMGDGMLEGYAANGWGDVAGPAVFGHEFAHHIQFQNGYFDDVVGDGTAPEQTRYTELMADAMSAYFLTHKRGMAMNRHRVASFLEAFYQIGDCGFTSAGHHGTPIQRMRAAQFGFDIADAAQKQGHIMSSQAFYELFVAEYPNIIAP